MRLKCGISEHGPSHSSNLDGSVDADAIEIADANLSLIAHVNMWMEVWTQMRLKSNKPSGPSSGRDMWMEVWTQMQLK